MVKLTESAIENLAIELLESQGFQYLYGPDIAPDGSSPMRSSFEDVLLTDTVKVAIDRINPTIPPEPREDALRQLKRIHSPQLVVANETFHRMITEGINVSFRKGSETRGDYVWPIDFEKPEKITEGTKQIIQQMN